MSVPNTACDGGKQPHSVSHSSNCGSYCFLWLETGPASSGNAYLVKIIIYLCLKRRLRYSVSDTASENCALPATSHLRRFFCDALFATYYKLRPICDASSETSHL